MRGVIVAFFSHGHGFVKLMTDPNDRNSTTGDGHYFHMDDCPDMPDVIQSREDIVGMVVDFEIVAHVYKTKAINLKPVETI